jgi:5-methylcytosine-specific restriction endonuclease McrA
MKRSTAEQKKTEAYRRIDALRERFCTGCGRSDVLLTHSHLIPQRRLAQYDVSLIAEPELITFHCPSCHERFENHDPSLLDFRQNLRIIEKYDQEQAQKIKGINNL